MLIGLYYAIFMYIVCRAQSNHNKQIISILKKYKKKSKQSLLIKTLEL